MEILPVFSSGICSKVCKRIIDDYCEEIVTYFLKLNKRGIKSHDTLDPFIDLYNVSNDLFVFVHLIEEIVTYFWKLNKAKPCIKSHDTFGSICIHVFQAEVYTATFENYLEIQL